MKYIILTLSLVVIIGGVGFYLYNQNQATYVAPTKAPEPALTTTTSNSNVDETATTTTVRLAKESIGQSVNGNDIFAYHFGTGETELLFIGGTHGAYAANTITLSHELIAHFKANEKDIPDNITVTIIPVLNPDGLEKIAGTPDVIDDEGKYTFKVTSESEHAATIPGRFNANEVDLNRNFDCDWKETSTWQSRTVSGGEAPFSEPEAKALRTYVKKTDPTAVVVWFSAEGKVYPSSCNSKPSEDSVTLANTYGKASAYPVETIFNAYEVNGDMVNWLAKEGIPAISVLLPSHTNVSLPQNKLGVEAVVKLYAN